jgi:hypothetical protein
MFRALLATAARSLSGVGIDDSSGGPPASVTRFRTQRYLAVPGLLPPPMLDYLKVYYAILRSNGLFSHDHQCPSALALGHDPALDAVLEWMRPKISRLVGLALVPTYSYTRVYAKGDVLAPHTDRPACEISASIAVAIPEGAAPSALCLRPPDAAEARVVMREGDGCLYVGTEIAHWREPFDADGYIQLFLHFIAAGGSHFPRHAFDRRPRLGAPAAPLSPESGT